VVDEMFVRTGVPFLGGGASSPRVRPRGSSATIRSAIAWFLVVFLAGSGSAAPEDMSPADPAPPSVDVLPSKQGLEVPNDPYIPGPEPIFEHPFVRPVESQVRWVYEGYKSVQVNVDLGGNNISGDAANEPSIAIDPNNPDRIVIGWRQFDSILSDFRQAGRGYSHDGGLSWIFPGVLQRGEFGSDPVVDSDPQGNFYYYSLQPEREKSRPWGCWLYKSSNGGVTFAPGIYGYGGDKAWMTIDKTSGPSAGNIYIVWSPNAGCCGGNLFTRSLNGGQTFMPPIPVPLNPFTGTITVASDGSVYLCGAADYAGAPVMRSVDARVPVITPTFGLATRAYLGGTTVFGTGPNPGGLLGQIWIATGPPGPQSRNVYVCGSVRPLTGDDPLDVMFAASYNGGTDWATPVRVNDDFRQGPWQWFATMSVAPNGRIDVIWNDTRDDVSVQRSQVYYSNSNSEGRTWSTNVAVSVPFEHHVGYPQQNKLGDYYHMISDNEGTNLAYAATFNGEQDVYFLRIERQLERCVATGEPVVAGLDCNGNGVTDDCDIKRGTSDDKDSNFIPDECESDFDGDGLVDGGDPDIDNDGVMNLRDICDHTPLGYNVLKNGRTFGDLDESCSTDLVDYGLLQACFIEGGPSHDGLFRYCVPNFDADGDKDVDLFDVAEFQLSYTGF